MTDKMIAFKCNDMREAMSVLGTLSKMCYYVRGEFVSPLEILVNSRFSDDCRIPAEIMERARKSLAILHGNMGSAHGKQEKNEDDGEKRSAEIVSNAKSEFELAKDILFNDALFPGICMVEYDEKAARQDRFRIAFQFSVNDDKLLRNIKAWHEAYCDIALIWWKEEPYSFLSEVSSCFGDGSPFVKIMNLATLRKIQKHNVVPRDLNQAEIKECMDMIATLDVILQG